MENKSNIHRKNLDALPKPFWDDLRDIKSMIVKPDDFLAGEVLICSTNSEYYKDWKP